MRDAILITGPTASGKTALAVQLAAEHNGVVVNADSMQVYDTLNVLTARPQPADMAGIEHRLYGHVPAGAAYSTGDWLREATARLLEPWLGTGLDLAELPVPRLVIVTIDETSPPDFVAMRAQLAREIPQAFLDDHRTWVDRLVSMARTTVLIGTAILSLVFVAMVLTVVFATRGTLSGNRHIVEVLHFVGAEASFVAKEFQMRGTFRFDREFELAVQLLAEKLIDVKPLITATLPFGSAVEAFELAGDRSQSMKVQLAF